MDHIVYLDAQANELENLVKGNKSMIIRGTSEKKLPYTIVREGDILYFLNNSDDCEIRARGVAKTVYSSDKLSVEESFETIIRNQDKLQLPDRQFESVAGKEFLVLIDLDGVEEVKPLRINKRSFCDLDDWIPVGKIEECIMNGIILI